MAHPMLLLLSALVVRANVTLPVVLGETHGACSAVCLCIFWSTVDRGAVAVEFRGETRSAAADELGRWSVYLRPVEPGGPFELTIKGRKTIARKDVLVGDAWVASGHRDADFRISGRSPLDGGIRTAAGPGPPR